MISFPKDTARLKWTRHIKNKMVFYHLSGATILGIFRRPERTEEGVAPQTAAAMRIKKHSPFAKGRGPLAVRDFKNPPSRSDHPPLKKEEEIWIMYQTKPGKKITMISAWRYPGKTKPGAPVPIPDDILTELTEAGTLEA